MCIWSVQADIFDFNDTEILDRIYINDDVARFLKASDSIGIAASKGMGKTFLLKAKRLKMSQDNSILTLPKDLLVDVSCQIPIGKKQIKFLSSYSNWVSLWIACISIYLLSLDNFSYILEEGDFEQFSECVKNLLHQKNTGIFNVLHKILKMDSSKELNIIIHDSPLLFDYTQRIQQQVAIFIDKLEEPFNREYFHIAGSSTSAEGAYNASIWAYAQLAFSEAVYSFYSSRHHIKIFYSIRKEALYNGEQISTEYQKLRNRVVRLKYSPTDLYNMFHLYISKENPDELCCPEFISDNPVKALIGIDKITHRSGNQEMIWDYIYRHTFQRPRDIMEMCEAIHHHIVKNKTLQMDSDENRIKILRRWVNEISTMECMSYLSFLEPFMSQDDNIQFKEKILSFVRTLPMNVFTQKSMQFFCHKYNNNTYEYNCIDCKNIHFFSTLYNIGLLGYIHKSVNDQSLSNKIKHFDESRFDSVHQSLPQGKIYYVHPGLGNIIQKERDVAMLNYIPCKFIINEVNNRLTHDDLGYIVDSVEATLGNLNYKNVFITSTGRDLSDTRLIVRNLLTQRGYTVYMYEQADFPELPSTEENMKPGITHDHCIDVLMTCHHVIYLFSGRFGGEYQGSRYKRYYINESIIKITPSVSFMEFLVAKRNGKNVKIYIDEKVDIARGEYLANEKSDAYKSNIVDKPNLVFEQLSYFNKLGLGTWYDKYNNIETLQKFIEAHFPNRTNNI